jgi:hypothetical protein
MASIIIGRDEETQGAVEPLLVVDATYPDHLVRGADNQTITATVLYDPSDPYVRVNNDFLRNGIEDRLGAIGVESNVMLPDETGVFSSRLYAHPEVPLGPRTPRIKAEVRDSSGTQHATVADFPPFEVVDSSAPGGRRRDLSNSSAALLFVNRNGPTSPTPSAPALATDAQLQWPWRAQFAEGTMLQDSLSAGFRPTRGQDNDAFWSTVGHEDNALDPSAWAVLELATAGRLGGPR